MSSANTEVFVTRTANTGLAAIGYKPSGAYSSSNVLWEAGMTVNNNSFSTRIWDGSSNKSYLVLTNDGNVGLGGNVTNTTDLTGSSVVIKSGNVGIGTTTVGSRVVIQGSDTTSGNSALNVLDSAGSSKMIILNNGNVGIGTTAPGAKLEVDTGADATKGLIVKANSATQSANLQEWQNSGGGVQSYVDASGSFVTRPSGTPTDASIFLVLRVLAVQD